MDVFEMLDELEDIIESGTRVPLTGKVLVDAEEVLDCIDQIRAVLPEEIRQARWIAKERERVLADAKQEAEETLKRAQTQIEQMALESEMVKMAEQKAQEILARAKSIEMEMREGAMAYAEQILDQLESNLNKALESIRESKSELQGLKVKVG
ncbi:MAG TPA: ATPase [Clostridia bacterium]|nr:ATPase [Clostridia bacterium]